MKGFARRDVPVGPSQGSPYPMNDYHHENDEEGAFAQLRVTQKRPGAPAVTEALAKALVGKAVEA